MEIELVNLCEKVHTIKRPSRSFPVFKSGSVFEKAKAYLEDVSMVDFSVISNEWRFLLMMRMVRNAIIHKDSNIEAPKPTEGFYAEKLAVYTELVAFSRNEGLLTLEEHPKDSNKAKVSITSYSLSILFLDKAKEIFNKIIPQINLSSVV